MSQLPDLTNVFFTFLVLLLSLRLAPAVFRRAFAFSREAKDLWFERRNLGKRYDSYQWQKLFWIGIGMALHALQSRQHFPAALALAATCLVAGAFGVLVWRYRVTRRQAREVS